MEQNDIRHNPRIRPGAASLIALAVVSGCNFVPRSRVEEGRQVAQTLRSENVRLKDQTLALRAKNQDLIQRAQDDAQRLAMQDEAVQRLEKSVSAYQSEREQLSQAYETIKRQAQLAATGKVAPSADWNGLPHPDGDPIETFVGNHPDWQYDAERKTLSIASDRLFDRGSNALKPAGEVEIRAAAEALGTASKASESPLALEVDAPGELSDVRQAVFEEEADTEAARRFSAASRAAKVRQALLGPTGIDPALARIAPPVEDQGEQDKSDPRVTLRLVPAARTNPTPAAALDSAPNRN